MTTKAIVQGTANKPITANPVRQLEPLCPSLTHVVQFARPRNAQELRAEAFLAQLNVRHRSAKTFSGTLWARLRRSLQALIQIAPDDVLKRFNTCTNKHEINAVLGDLSG